VAVAAAATDAEDEAVPVAGVARPCCCAANADARFSSRTRKDGESRASIDRTRRALPLPWPLPAVPACSLPLCSPADMFAMLPVVASGFTGPPAEDAEAGDGAPSTPATAVPSCLDDGRRLDTEPSPFLLPLSALLASTFESLCALCIMHRAGSGVEGGGAGRKEGGGSAK
jgi:hypothetical protein